MKKVKYFSVLIILIFFASCNPPNSNMETTDSTQLTTVAVPSETLNSEGTATKPEPEPELVISDSTANALNTLVGTQFNTLYQLLSDSSNYYKVEMEDYYDEYEGQDEMEKYTWYFDKEFSVVYSKYSYQNGAMFKPDVIEYIARNNSIICTIETSSIYDEDKFITIWDVQNGGVKLKYSGYSKKIESVEPLAADYSKTNQNTWDMNFDALKTTLAEEVKPRTGDEEVYTILIRKPKPAELVDYKEVIIPKALYDKLKQ